MRKIPLLFVVLFLLGFDLPGPRNRSSGGDQCIYTNVSGTMTSGLCVNGEGSITIGNVCTSGNLCAGTYTATCAAGTNVATCTSRQGQYIRVGNVVTVSASATVDLSAEGAFAFAITLPIASDLASTYDAAGSGGRKQDSGEAGFYCFADATNNRLACEGASVDEDAEEAHFTFSYVVK